MAGCFQLLIFMSKNDETLSSLNDDTFNDLGIKESILKIIYNLGLNAPTPIQRQAVPAVLSGKDIVGIAQTGTGKTFAFGIPMLQQLAINKGRGLVVLPTRELAGQVEKSLHKLGDQLGLRTALVIGGESVYKQLPALRRKPHIIVGTPGRLIDLLKSKNLNLNNVSVLVFDEADMMFDMGFAPQIEEIMQSVPKDRQTLLFSATMPAAVMKLAEKHLKTPIRIEVAPAGTTAALIDQEIYLLNRDDRWDQLLSLLNEYKTSILVFVRTKHGASKLAKKLKAEKHQAAEIHSNLSFSQRQSSLAGFRSGKYRILVATDVAARGLDINDIELVLNYDLPDNSEDYVHRIGRTARAGKKGKAISFASPQQRREILKIEQLIRKNLPIRKIAASNNKVVHTQGNTFSKPNFDQSGRPQTVLRQRPLNKKLKSREQDNRNSSLGFKKRSDKVDITATPDYLKTKTPKSLKTTKSPIRLNSQKNTSQNRNENVSDFVPLMHNPNFDGGNRFAFRRNLYQLKEASKPKRRTYNNFKQKNHPEKSEEANKKQRSAAGITSRTNFKTGVRTSGSTVFKPKEKSRGTSDFKAKSFTPRYKRK